MSQDCVILVVIVVVYVVVYVVGVVVVVCVVVAVLVVVLFFLLLFLFMLLLLLLCRCCCFCCCSCYLCCCCSAINVYFSVACDGYSRTVLIHHCPPRLAVAVQSACLLIQPHDERRTGLTITWIIHRTEMRSAEVWVDLYYIQSVALIKFWGNKKWMFLCVQNWGRVTLLFLRLRSFDMSC